MQKKLLFLIPMLLVLFALLVPIASSANPSTNAPIRMQSTIFVPAKGEMPNIAPELALAANQQARRGYYIVQFAGPVQQAWKDAVTAAGGELLGYIPDYAFKVRMNPVQAAAVADLTDVAWVGVFQPAFKLSADLELGGTNLYRVRVERGADFGAARAAVAQSGAQVLRYADDIMLISADATQIDAIAQILDVAWVENFKFAEKHNEYGAGVIIGGNTANSNGYDGSTQTAAVADTGLGGGTGATAHADVPASRVTAVYNWTTGNAQFCYRVRGDGPQDVDSGHGTHVAVSVVGDGGANGEGQGTAPAAHLVFQAVEDYLDIYGACTSPTTPDGYYLIGIPDDLHQLFQQAYNAGARIHANSWGSNAAGDYTLDSANADDFIWDNPDFLVTFSAGNEGIDANSNGVVDNDSIGSPATAKNVLTVGASENDRGGNYNCDTNLGYTSHDAYQSGQTCNSMGGQNILGTYGSRWPADYPAAPLFGDLTAGNAEQMASFSSRGPTDDGRIKPDIVAPGTWVLSGYSALYQEGYGDPTNPQNSAYQVDGWGMPVNVNYKYFGGTSMSNPIAAGGAVVVRDYYQKAHSVNASAALVKATLINSAVDLLDENNDGSNDNDFPIPNVHEGWGRINLAKATDGSLQYVNNTSGIGTGGSASYAYSHDGSGPFKVTLVWSDYASTEAASSNLVNNLNLTVTAPNGAVYRGNVFSGGWSQTGGSADSVNNVENVYVQNAVAGTWTVQVSGANVPQGPQPFALVVDASSGGNPNPTATPSPTGAPPTPTPTATATTPAGGTMHVGDIDATTSPSNGGKWSASFTITIHNSNESPLSNATVSWVVTNGASGSGSCSTNASGQCTVSFNNINKNISGFTFSVTNVTHASNTYDSGSNHDPDGDSNGSSIAVTKP